jgi:hypothetical protein
LSISYNSNFECYFCISALTGSSTSSLRHHIRSKHPRDWVKVLEAEKAKAEQDAANKAEAKKLQEDMEGDPEEEEEDLTPGTPVTIPDCLLYYEFNIILPHIFVLLRLLRPIFAIPVFHKYFIFF